jgi:hypothetical protein
MSTWTSRAAAALALGACVADGPAPPTTAAQGFALAAPRGFCPVGGAPPEAGPGTFAAFARCAGAAGPPAFLTATVGGPGSGTLAPDPAEIAAVLTSEAGRAMLSRAGEAGTVTVHEVVAAEGVTLVRLTDTAPGGPQAGPGWRAVAAMAGRLVTLTVSGTTDRPLDPAAARQLIDAFLRAVRRANGG